MKSIRTIFFDLDGTIVNTEPSAALAIEQCFKEWGVRMDKQDAHFINGRKWDAAFAYLFRKYRMPIPQARAAAEIQARYRKLLQSQLGVIAGAPEAVRKLAEVYPLGLVSGSNREEILWALGKLDLTSCFKVILGAEDYPDSKPAPDGYLMGLKLLGAKADETLVFEDSHAGIASGRNAGLWVVGIRAANYLGQDQSLAHEIVEDFTSIDVSWVNSRVF